MDETGHETMKVWGLTYWSWAVVYVVAVLAAVAAATRFGAPKWVVWVPLLLVPLMSRAQMGWLKDKGISSPALTRYSRNCLLTVFAYVACVVSAVQLERRFDLGRAEALGLTAVSMVAVAAMIWAMVRYLAEETDEYLRGRAIFAALFGLFAVLAFGSLWGFLELFGLAQGLWTGWVFPAWAIGLGLGNLWQWMRRQ